MSLSKLKSKLIVKEDPETVQSPKNQSHQQNDNSQNTEDIDEVDDQGQSVLMGIISQLRPGCDLSRITLPTFILERKSMLERITNQLQQPDLVIKAHQSKTELDRFLLIVKWYLSGWHIAPKAVKKPLNPVLGEYFTSWWDLSNGDQAFYISEQTSHHPPKSSYFYMIPNHNIRVDGAIIPKSRFLGNSTAAMMDGITVCQFLDILDSKGQPEKYTLTQPNMYARGILFGKMRIELGDHMIIKSPTTGYSIDIEFKVKGFISGSYDSIEGIVKDPQGKSIYEITGKWNDVIYLKNLTNGEKTVFWDTKKSNPQPPKVRPLEEQGEFESRNLWKSVTDALGQRNHELATEEKFKIEDHQRVLRQKRIEDGVEFHPKLFIKSKNPDDELEYYLYKSIPNDADPETKTKLILETVPILPGQKFTESFEIPGFKKLSINDDVE
ncbi:Oxysterol-binding protein [Wickerhamomyces ciferrii]|uniref:Oxysterol-binding protein n=1 Tax=Wickerhamomyces ciferrii (strain ATCC 14091 / BCRC 22168 / CBS 111 / JCM 3599 / NBRC 0793 / NRRL Y-1031 F-60-10) TaxID=1206466 RepID=K0L074_WICCF|nr:Oxysterol-binding protein [Wickerhamomyces ciferrii]CCH46793.1 Oxysterol-binding protein [Wickerhamomyces ciferrii]